MQILPVGLFLDLALNFQTNIKLISAVFKREALLYSMLLYVIVAGMKKFAESRTPDARSVT